VTVWYENTEEGRFKQLEWVEWIGKISKDGSLQIHHRDTIRFRICRMLVTLLILSGGNRPQIPSVYISQQLLLIFGIHVKLF
jgi:hypothetical protein